MSEEKAELRPMMFSGVRLRKMAASGSFAVDENTGNRMIEALEGVIDTLTARWAAIQRLQDTPRLSTTATAQWVSSHMVGTAVDERGLLTQLQHAKAEFPAYVEAIRIAKRNYKQREQETHDLIKRTGRTE
ncbi:hypothetical protein SAMN05421504_103103 [Amycolatopsis xylanica]|uniref:PE family protein n=1 Tax=Amycolatopsis xylanica TaxID=589385 RepID=A0A1H3CPB4_9PSEU|nr:hypothetical protein [Amycolatopsis xylanica]SDX55945.1 hypothetical protein SAMN05421504_103103 [Amycolatopsis xylanica]